MLKLLQAVIGPVLLQVEVAANKTISKTQGVGTCYAGVQVNSDGDLYEEGPGLGSFSSYETWLDNGSNSDVWVLCSVVSGSVSGDSTATRLACTSSRSWRIDNGGSGTTTAEVDLQFYDAASGGTLLDTQNVDLSASDI